MYLRSGNSGVPQGPGLEYKLPPPPPARQNFRTTPLRIFDGPVIQPNPANMVLLANQFLGRNHEPIQTHDDTKRGGDAHGEVPEGEVRRRSIHKSHTGGGVLHVLTCTARSPA